MFCSADIAAYRLFLEIDLLDCLHMAVLYPLAPGTSGSASAIVSQVYNLWNSFFRRKVRTRILVHVKDTSHNYAAYECNGSPNVVHRMWNL